jgi:UrcA family protein
VGICCKEYIIMTRSIDMVCLVAIAVAAVAIPILATANESKVLQYSAKELTSPVAVATLHGRIESAARQVCQQYSGRELSRQRVFALCTSRSVATAVRNMHSPALSAYHEARTGEHSGTAELASQLAGQPLPTGVRYR